MCVCDDREGIGAYIFRKETEDLWTPLQDLEPQVMPMVMIKWTQSNAGVYTTQNNTYIHNVYYVSMHIPHIYK